MGKESKIEWTTHTFNPWWGCTKVSPACAHCYAETWAKRTGQKVWGDDAPRRFFGDKHWNEPLKWNKEAEGATERPRVFCASMADVFEKRDDLNEQRERLWKLIMATRNLDWLLLTKRPENILEMIPVDWRDMPHANVWFGTTAENQEQLNKRYGPLVSVPANVRFLSCEPLLGPLVLGNAAGIDWVIVGGESGAGARPMNPDWARSIRDQCNAEGVAFHFKQWGDFNEHGARVGKKVAGRHLDFRTWDELPLVNKHGNYVEAPQ